VLPSECYENLPTVILEAWQYGVPVIASELGGMAELIKSGSGGVSFEAGNVESLVAKVKSLPLQVPNDLGAKIIQEYHARFSKNAYVKNLIQIYESISH
jgi:glycosyltransferase involved in cell wall biosynthesis